MTITPADTKPHPVWLLPKGSAGYLPGVTFYRAHLPAKMCGGRVVESLGLLNGAGRIEDFDIFDKGQADRLAAMPEATLFGLGSPTILVTRHSPACQYGSSRRSLTTILQALRDAGARILLDFDDDIFAYTYGAESLADFAREYLEGERLKILARRGVDVGPTLAAVLARLSLAPVITGGLVAKKAVEAYKLFMREWKALLTTAGIICSTEPLAAAFRSKCFADLDIVTAPNVCDPSEFAVTPRESKTVRIGYAGTKSHAGDMGLAMPGLLECAKLPNVELVFFDWHPRLKENLEPGVYEWQGVRYTLRGPFCNFYEFNRQIADLDIAVAPIAGSEFNECKSPQKWFEHSLNRTAMVLSDSPVYDCVEHRVTGFKAPTAEGFTYYLRRLVEDAELRRRMGEAARQAVLARHTVDQWAEHWRQAVLAGASEGSAICSA